MVEKINERRNIFVSDELWRRFKGVCVMERKTTGEKIMELIEKELDKKTKKEIEQGGTHG